MITLILAIGFALTLVLLAFAAWIAMHARYKHHAAAGYRDSNAYIAEVRRRQLAENPAGVQGSGNGVVLQFPHPPGVA